MSVSGDRKSTAELEKDVAAERNRVDETLGKIQARLTPGQLIDEVIHHGQGAGTDFVANLGRTLSANPIPTALVGVGLLWLLLAPHPQRSASTASSADTSDTPSPAPAEAPAPNSQ
jgi:uncharacterized protein DUF3618